MLSFLTALVALFFRTQESVAFKLAAPVNPSRVHKFTLGEVPPRRVRLGPWMNFTNMTNWNWSNITLPNFTNGTWCADFPNCTSFNSSAPVAKTALPVMLAVAACAASVIVPNCF